ncbi:MAG TPA: S46 family peptidase [Balneolales bacterium]|nr:S46 family peptidase [Balneolales bacterium]
MKTISRKLFAAALLSLFILGQAFAQSVPLEKSTPDDAGMWLLPQIKGAVYHEMEMKGLKLGEHEFYSTDSTTLNKAIIRVNIGEGGGGTGSFISPKGLILTNHHIGYDAVASASTEKDNYLKNGFIAHNFQEEIPAKGYSLYIPIEQKDVTQEIRSHVPDDAKGQERMQLEQQVRQQLIQQRENGNPDLKAEIDDYWAGNKQYMSVYRVIRDVRVVFAPPSSIGKYGGDIDNWMWPRHTGDFTFLRAYVAPDGSGRAYNKDNVPYKPQRFLKVSLNGFKENDFTMIMGFPGKTYRHESSYAFNFYENHRNPYLIQVFKSVLDGLEYAAKQDPKEALKNASDRADFANEYKYYKGVQKGFKKYHITARRKAQEDKFAGWIAQDQQRQQEYGNVLTSLQRGYELADKSGDDLYASYYTLHFSNLLQVASLFEPYYHYLASDTATFTNAGRDSILARRDKMMSGNVNADILTLKEMMKMLVKLPSGKQIGYVQQNFAGLSGEQLSKAIDAYMNNVMETSVVFNKGMAHSFLYTNKKKAAQMPKDELVQLFEALLNTFQQSRQVYMSHFSLVNPAQTKYVRGMMAFRNDSTEYPDANFTLRLTGGRIMGYYPQDGVYYRPITTLDGVIAKNTGKKPFNVPQPLMQWYNEHTTGHRTFTPKNRYLDSKGRMVVDFLSTNDITGGNSGSPVLNAEGQLIGAAFDGNIEGVVGDYFFDPDLNRTISVDVRYVMFITDKIYHVNRIINEVQFAQPEPAVMTN